MVKDMRKERILCILHSICGGADLQLVTIPWHCFRGDRTLRLLESGFGRGVLGTASRLDLSVGGTWKVQDESMYNTEMSAQMQQKTRAREHSTEENFLFISFRLFSFDIWS